MSNRHTVQFSVRNLHIMTRIAELFEEEANGLSDDAEAAFWQDMAAKCRQQAAGRRADGAVTRPLLKEIRQDVVERVVEGEPPYPRLSGPEAREVERLLTQQGKSARHIAYRVEVTPRTVNRWRREDNSNNQ